MRNMTPNRSQTMIPNFSPSSPAASPRPPCGAYLANSEADLLRIVEDLINVLIDQNLILLTDFPEGAQRKLMRRQGIRQKLQTF